MARAGGATASPEAPEAAAAGAGLPAVPAAQPEAGWGGTAAAEAPAAAAAAASRLFSSRCHRNSALLLRHQQTLSDMTTVCVCTIWLSHSVIRLRHSSHYSFHYGERLSL